MSLLVFCSIAVCLNSFFLLLLIRSSSILSRFNSIFHGFAVLIDIFEFLYQNNNNLCELPSLTLFFILRSSLSLLYSFLPSSFRFTFSPSVSTNFLLFPSCYHLYSYQFPLVYSSIFYFHLPLLIYSFLIIILQASSFFAVVLSLLITSSATWKKVMLNA